MVVGVVVFAVGGAGAVASDDDGDDEARAGGHDTSWSPRRRRPRSPRVFADFFTPEALRHASRVTRQVVSVVEDAYLRRRALQAPPVLSLAGNAFTDPGGARGFNPLAGFMRVAAPPLPPPGPPPPSSSSLPLPAPLALESGLVRLVARSRADGAFGDNNDDGGGGAGGPSECGDLLLLWQVAGGDVAFCVLAEEADNLALVDTCLGAVRLCLREALRVRSSGGGGGGAASSPPKRAESPSPQTAASGYPATPVSLSAAASLPSPPLKAPSGSGNGGGKDGGKAVTAAAVAGGALTARAVLGNPALLMAVLHHVMPSGKLMFVGVDAARTISLNVRQRLDVVAS